MEYFPAQHGLHHIQNRRLHRTNEKRHNLVFDDTRRQNGTQDSTCVEMCSFGRQSRSDTPFPQGLEPFRASYVILPSLPFPSPRRPSPRRTITYENPDLCGLAQSLPYRRNIAATRKFPLFHIFNSLLLKAFDLFSTTSDSGVPRLVTLMALTERGKMDENI